MLSSYSYPRNYLNHHMSTSDTPQPNPYASPLTGDSPMVQATPVGTAQETHIRRQRRGIEAGLRQNTLCLVGIYVLLSAVAIVSTLGWWGAQPSIVSYASAISFTLASLTGIAVLWGVNRSAAWARLPLTMMAICGLLLFPLGTIFAALILITLHVRAQPRLLSEEYERIVRATPEMNARMSVMGYVAMLLLVVLGVSIVIVSQFPPEIRRMHSSDR